VTAMIPDSGRHVAVFRIPQKGGGYSWNRKPVMAWDSFGNPLVVDLGRLSNAHDVPYFHVLLEGHGPVVGIAPGGGWHIKWRDPEDGEISSSPVVGWAIHADGTCLPLDTDALGCAAMPGDDGVPHMEAVLYHPDIQPRPWEIPARQAVPPKNGATP
jgi:hypothetical protein